MKPFALTLLCLCCLSFSALAGEVDVLNVEIQKSSQGIFTFSVTLQHEDTGWDHFANKWEIIDEENNILGTRILYHPHVEEQPFTRNLSGLMLSEDLKTVTVRGHDSLHAYGGKVITLELP